MTDQDRLRVLITGCSSGLGLRIAQTQAACGHRVFATMRDVTGRNAPTAKQLSAINGIDVIELDLCDDASVSGAVEKALELAGGIDVLVNNAGVTCSGLLESFRVDEVQHVLDVNVIGAMRVTHAVLPAMRSTGGLLVNISSVLGRLCIPFMAPYCASKAALEMLSVAWHYELAAFGIESVLVEPGGYLTNVYSRAIKPADPSPAEAYGPVADLPEKMLAGMQKMLAGKRAPDPQEVADVVRDVIAAPRGTRPLRTVSGGFGANGVDTLNADAQQAQEALTENIGLSRARLAAMKPT